MGCTKCFFSVLLLAGSHALAWALPADSNAPPVDFGLQPAPAEAPAPDPKGQVQAIGGSLLLPALSNMAPASPASEEVVMHPTVRESEKLMAQVREMQAAGLGKEAIVLLEKIVVIDPALTTAWEQLGWAYWKAGDTKKTFELWQRLKMIEPDNPRIYNLLGQASMAANDLPQAIAYYQRSLQLDPRQYETRFQLARVLRWTGRMLEATPLLQQLIKENPARNDVKVELATSLLDSWQYEEAKPLWTEIVAANPTNDEYQLELAVVTLHTGNRAEALRIARATAARNPDSMTAQMVLIDTEEYGEHPQSAIPLMKRAIADSPSLLFRQNMRVRLIRLLIALHKKDPKGGYALEAISIARDRLQEENNSVDGHLLLGELLILDLQFSEATSLFEEVIRDYNANNRRAYMGLFETAIGEGRFDDADVYLEKVREFNPLNPYLHYFQARLYAAQGDYARGVKELKELETIGANGAVAVMLYHGLTTSPFGQVLSVDRFREQLLAFKKAGFRFATPDEMPGLLRSSDDVPHTVMRAPPRRAMVITFDDARRDSFLLATPVAQQMRAIFAMHVPVGNVLQGDPFIANWGMLRDYLKTGAWTYGSHLMDASTPMPINPEGDKAYPLANLLWMKDQMRYESDLEYYERLHREYAASQAILASNLNIRAPIFAAYPMGDIGQETSSNFKDARNANLEESSQYYQIGFIQSQFGWSVAGDNPLMYQRNERSTSERGDESVIAVLEAQPVYLARRTQAEYAAMQGKHRTATKLLKALREDGYPEKSADELEAYIRARMAGSFANPATVTTDQKAWYEPDISRPYVGVDGSWFTDNQGRRNWWLAALAGVNVTPTFTGEGQIGVGDYKQQYFEKQLQTQYVTTGVFDVNGQFVPGQVYAFTNRATVATNDLDIGMRFVGLRATLELPFGLALAGDMKVREFAKYATNNQMTAYSLEAQIRPLLELDLMGRYEKDIVPAAHAVFIGTTYQLYMGQAVLHILDDWNIWGAIHQYDFSDDNTRGHATIGTLVEVWEEYGLNLGARYGYVSADNASEDYWSPYHLRRMYLEAVMRRNRLKLYYNLQARIGWGQEDVRPEDMDLYNQRVARSKLQSFDPGPAPDGPSSMIIGLSASSRYKVTKYWELNGDISYNRLPDYSELTIMGGVKYYFFGMK